MEARSSSGGTPVTPRVNTHFVVYDPRHSARDRYLERSKALSHAARSYHSRRRRGGTSACQAFTPKPKSAPKSCTCSHECNCESSRQVVEARCTRFQLVPENGSGDPFGGLPIMITKEVHETIVFWTTPALWDCIHNYSHGKSRKSYFRLEMEQDVLNLQHELDAIMFLHQSAALMHTLYQTEELERRKLRLKRQALQILRENVELSSACPDQDSYINALICATMAALCEGNEHEARMHSGQVQLLIKSLESQKDDPRIVTLTTRLGRVFFFDVLFALTRGRPVIFHEEHLPTHMQSMIQAQNEWVRKLRAYVQGRITLQPPLSQAIADLFHGWRIDMILYGEPPVGSRDFSEMAAFYYTFATSHKLYDQTLHLMKQKLAEAELPNTSPRDAQIRNTEAMLAAGLLMQVSILQHIIQPVGEVAYANGTAHLLHRLLEPTLTDDDTDNTTTTTTARQPLPTILEEAQLWVLYCAACWEITYLHNAPLTKWNPWFVAALRRKSLAMGLGKWKEASAVFEQYWPTSLMAPDGAEWFDELMLHGTVRAQIRGANRNCCWQQACTLRPKGESVRA